MAKRAKTVHTILQIAAFKLEVDEVSLGYARTKMPILIRASAGTGRAFHIRNVNNPKAASVLLVSSETLAKLVCKPISLHSSHLSLNCRVFRHA